MPPARRVPRPARQRPRARSEEWEEAGIGTTLAALCRDGPRPAAAPAGPRQHGAGPGAKHRGRAGAASGTQLAPRKEFLWETPQNRARALASQQAKTGKKTEPWITPRLVFLVACCASRLYLNLN